MNILTGVIWRVLFLSILLVTYSVPLLGDCCEWETAECWSYGCSGLTSWMIFICNDGVGYWEGDWPITLPCEIKLALHESSVSEKNLQT